MDRGYFKWLVLMIFKVSFQPQYGVPLGGPAFFASQMFQATMVWFYVKNEKAIIVVCVMLFIMMLLSLIFFRGRFVRGLMYAFVTMIIELAFGELVLKIGLLFFTVFNTILIYGGIIFGEFPRNDPAYYHGVDRMMCHLENTIFQSWPWRFGVWMVTATFNLLRSKPRLRTDVTRRNRRAKWIAAQICSVGLPICIAQVLIGNFEGLSEYPLWMTILSWGHTLLTYASVLGLIIF